MERAARLHIEWNRQLDCMSNGTAAALHINGRLCRISNGIRMGIAYGWEWHTDSILNGILDGLLDGILDENANGALNDQLDYAKLLPRDGIINSSGRLPSH